MCPLATCEKAGSRSRSRWADRAKGRATPRSATASPTGRPDDQQHIERDTRVGPHEPDLAVIEDGQLSMSEGRLLWAERPRPGECVGQRVGTLWPPQLQPRPRRDGCVCDDDWGVGGAGADEPPIWPAMRRTNAPPSGEANNVSRFPRRGGHGSTTAR